MLTLDLRIYFGSVGKLEASPMGLWAGVERTHRAVREPDEQPRRGNTASVRSQL